MKNVPGWNDRPYTRYEIAEALASSWRLGDETDAMMPLGGGLLDRAVELLREVPYFGDLTFSDTAVGRRCLEMPDILLAAQEIMLIEAVSPAFTHAAVKLDTVSARMMAVGLGMSTAEAAEIGRNLRESAGAKSRPQAQPAALPPSP